MIFFNTSQPLLALHYLLLAACCLLLAACCLLLAACCLLLAACCLYRFSVKYGKVVGTLIYVTLLLF
jgi:hypothetical protein